ncbi:MAG: hypothetical protein GC171_01215 [Terrimonas sp.]|nr:hypothetical protein [Terrimonas sp.]
MKKGFLFLWVVLASFSTALAQKDSLQEYTGVYLFPEGSVVPDVEVTLTDSILNMYSTAGSSLLVKEAKDLYTIVEFQGTALFKRSETGVVNGVHIEAGGYILDGIKKENGLWSFRYIQYPGKMPVITESIK